jgi:hypothetical protein
VKRSVSPRKYFNFSIHAPGLGRMWRDFGKRAVMIKGKDRPRPIKINIRKILKVEVVKAKASAVPRNGAEQGVERIVVKTPERKSPVKPSLSSVEPSFDPPGVLNSKSPNKFNERIKRISIIMRRNAGDWS